MSALEFIRTYAATLLSLGPIAVGVALTVLAGARMAVAASLAVALGIVGVALVLALSGASADPLGAGAMALLAVVAATALCAAGPVLSREFDRRTQPIALGLALMALGAALGAAQTRDLLRLVIFLMTGGIAVAALTSLSVARERAVAPAAFTAVLVTVCAGAIALCGVGLFYAAAGAFDVTAIATSLSASPGREGMVAAALLIAALVAFAGVAPAHGWAADVAARTPHGTASIVIVVARIAAFVALIRVYGLTQAVTGSGAATAFALGCACLGAIGVVAGSLQAIGASDARRLAAHALTAQFGCALIGLAAGGADGAVAALFVVAAGAMTALALVVGAAAARPQLGAAAPMSALDGLAAQRPFVAAAMGVAAFGLTGAPLTAAFLGKWLSIEAALARGWYWAAAAIVLASFAAVFVAGQIIERMYFRERSAQIGPAPAGALSMAPALLAAVTATLVFGWNGAAPLEAARLAARAMTGAP